MIEKLLELTGLGVLKDGLPGGHVAFGQSTVIYGENGRGKSLLAALLRSLKTGDAGHLRPRETLDSDSSLGARLVISGSHYELKDFAWRPDTFEGIEIFDSEFVARNVYSGDAVEASHRQNLCQFVMGGEGVELAERIDRLNQESRRFSRRIKDAESTVEDVLDGVMSLDSFLNLESNAGLERRIQQVEAAQRAAADAAEILTGAGLREIELPFPPPADLLEALSESCDATPADAEAVADHIRKHLSDDGEAWLQRGLEHMGEGRCPFCDQSTEGVSLVAAMKSYFSQKYTSFRQDIEAASHAVERHYRDANLWSLRETIADNQRELAFWSAYIEIPELPSPWPLIQSAWIDLRAALRKAFERKLSNPRLAIDRESATVEVSETMSAALRAVEQYNAAVAVVNDSVASKQAETETLDLETIEANLARLHLHEKRFQPKTARLCSRIVELRERKSDIRAEKASLRQRLDEYVELFASRYQDTLNQFISRCDAAFSLSNLKTVYHGGTPRTDYQIRLFGNSIRASAKPSAKPHFATALSEGDRRTLALAFFLARIKRDRNLRNKIVVLDDPTCSLGWHRRGSIVTAVSEIAAQCRQLIVLTHEPGFALQCARKLGAAYISTGRSLSTVCIEKDGPWSVMVSCEPRDFEEMLPADGR